MSNRVAMFGASVRPRSVLLAIVWLGWSVASHAQSVSTLSFTPPVITATSAVPVLVEAELSGSPSRVDIDFNPAGTTNTVIALRDDGAGGDRRPGDRIYAAQLPVAPILAARAADDVNRVFIGYLNVHGGETRVGRFNLFVDVYTSDIGEYPITRLSRSVQATTRLVNFHDGSHFASRNSQALIREFYRLFPDDYDVLNLVYVPLRFENRSHEVIKNTVRGIGLGITDRSASYGSDGRLQGISRFPIAGFYDGAETGVLHELGHQWINHIRVRPFSDGSPHWPYSSMASGIMGFSVGGRAGGQGGHFPCEITEGPAGLVMSRRTDAPGYNDLDLYLMGLLAGNEVRDQFVLADQTAGACNPGRVTGAVTRVRIADVVAALGRRTPAAGNAPTTIRTATILVTRDGPASPELMSFYSWMAERAEWRARVPTHSGFLKELGQPFFVATRGRGTLQTDVNLRRPDFAITATSAAARVTNGVDARFEIAATSRRSTFEAPVTLSCDTLPANASCLFEQPAVTPGASGRTVPVTIATRGVARGAHVVIVSGRSGAEKHSTALSLTIQ